MATGCGWLLAIFTASCTWISDQEHLDRIAAAQAEGDGAGGCEVGVEVCDGEDNDCDGAVDEEGAEGAGSWYPDGDGWGAGEGAVSACEAPAGYRDAAGDCEDGDPAVNPGADEVCDEADADEDCDGVADDEDDGPLGTTTFYADGDEDDYGDDEDTLERCAAPEGYVAGGGDCDDGDDAIHPGAEDYCDGVDDNCSGDETDAPDAAGEYFVDADGDCYGDDEQLVALCEGEATAGAQRPRRSTVTTRETPWARGWRGPAISTRTATRTSWSARAVSGRPT